MPDQTTTADERPTAVRHDWTQSDYPSVTLIEAVAAATNRSETDLPPLQRTVDPDALDALLTGRQSSPVTVSFRYADTDVRVDGNGSIDVRVDGDLTEVDDENRRH